MSKINCVYKLYHHALCAIHASTIELSNAWCYCFVNTVKVDSIKTSPFVRKNVRDLLYIKLFN